jgi:hypothetical protein
VEIRRHRAWRKLVSERVITGTDFILPQIGAMVIGNGMSIPIFTMICKRRAIAT